MNREVFSSLTDQNKRLRSLEDALKEKDKMIAQIMTERRKENGKWMHVSP